MTSHIEPPTMRKTTVIVRIVAPALSPVVIGACSVVGSFAAVEPASGSLLDVAPLAFERGAMESLLSNEPTACSAHIYVLSAKGSLQEGTVGTHLLSNTRRSIPSGCKPL